jgi:hypothetical protein
MLSWVRVIMLDVPGVRFPHSDDVNYGQHRRKFEDGHY